MKEMSKDPLQSFTKMLAKDKKLFKKQFKEVEKKYPLVILAYRIQQAVIAGLSRSRYIAELGIGSIYGVLETSDFEAYTRAEVEQQQRLKKLKDCLRRADTSGASSGERYQAGVACFDNYVSGNNQ